MTHPYIAQAVALARREDMLRAVSGRTGVVVSRRRSRERGRLLAWLDAQRLRRRGAPRLGTANCVACTR